MTDAEKIKALEERVKKLEEEIARIKRWGNHSLDPTIRKPLSM